MKKDITKLWVDSDFKRFIKKKAADNDMTIIDYTRSIVEEEEIAKDEKRKLKFFF